MKNLIKIIIVNLLFSVSLLANIGTITALKGNVKILSNAVNIEASLGVGLNEKDHVITANNSKAQIIFKDETIVTVGKNSDFSIATYLYEADSEPTVEFGLLRGAMRTITGQIGKIAPHKFKVKTKNATIGIRGTNFTILSRDDGSLQAYCTYGAIHITLNSKGHTIKQGYFLNVGVDGKQSIHPFTAKELSRVNNENFGKDENLRGTGNEEGNSVDVTVGLDVRVENVSAIATSTVSQSTLDATQTSETSTYITMIGHSIDTDANTLNKSLANLRFTTDGSSFDSANSWIEVKNKNNDDWQFFVASTPTVFTSKDEFQTTFSSLKLTPGSGSSSSNAKLTSSNFNATVDLKNDDYMSWGSWNVDVSFQAGVSVPSEQSLSMQGLWVTGEATNADVVAALTGSNVFYSGKFNALDFTGSTPLSVTGNASIVVDFGTNRNAALTINYENGDGTGVTTFNNMPISGNTISGSQSSGPGSANGTFYGPNGNSIGGNFSSNTQSSISSVGIKGVYEVTRQSE